MVRSDNHRKLDKALMSNNDGLGVEPNRRDGESEHFGAQLFKSAKVPFRVCSGLLIGIQVIRWKRFCGK